MPIFDFTFTVNAPVSVVSAFHHDARALKKLTPPPTFVQIHTVEPLAQDSVAEFTLWMGPMPIRWKAVHRDVSENGFTDVQVSGPMKKWEHTHRFLPQEDGTTRVAEHIEYEHPAFPFGQVTRILFSQLNLYVLFSYRKWVTKRACKRQASTA